MRRSTTYAIVIARLILVAIMLVIRWLLFEPLSFIGVIVSTIGETGLNGLNNAIKNIQIKNNELLTENQQ
jgi:hypothetical protein